MGLFDRLFAGGDAAPARLERALWRFNQEKTAAAQQAALEVLLAARLFVPSLRDVGEAMEQLTTIVLDTAQGPAVVAFTAPERMDLAWAQRVGAKAGISTEARWLIETLPDHLGLMINPELATGLLLPAAGLAAFRKTLVGTS